MRPLGYRALWGVLALATRFAAPGGVAHAQNVDGLQVAWNGPAECPAPSRLHAEVLELLGADFTLSGSAQARVRLRAVEAGYRLELSVRSDGARGERTLQVPTCAEAQKAAPVLIALSLRPDAPAPHVPQEPVPPPAPVEPGAEPGPREASVRPNPYRFGLGIFAGFDASSLVAPSAALGARGVLRHGPLQLRADLGLVVPRRVALGGTTRGELSSGLASLGVSGCVGPRWGRWHWSGCAGAELGLYWAASHGVAVPESDRTLWVAGLAGTALTCDLGRISLQLDALALVPFTRPVLALDDLGPQSTTAGVGFRALIGVSVGLGSVDSAGAGH